jgi:hypothetical protein
MTGLVVLCILALCWAAPSVFRARQAARKDPIPTWVKRPPECADVNSSAGENVWSEVDDRELVRLLSQSS